ncbi:MAG: glycosyltransferase [Prevotella sp.]
MRILIVVIEKLPVVTYGGTERVVWYLARELRKMGHEVSFLAKPGSWCEFAKCYYYDSSKPIDKQIPENIDVIHFNNSSMGYTGQKPYIVTYHGNNLKDIDQNAVFVSRNHAERHHSACFVHNGLDWDDYGPFEKDATRSYFHFLGKAAWRVKNVKGAINVINALPNEKLYVLGGYRLNFKMGFRFTLSPKIKFKGMVGGEEKNEFLRHSKGLVFPVRWDEPFGLAITESLYFGAPVFATPYGSLPELVTREVGFLTSSKSEMIRHISDDYDYNPVVCHEYAQDLFNSKLMAERYLEKYEIVVNGQKLNDIKPYFLADESCHKSKYAFD